MMRRAGYILLCFVFFASSCRTAKEVVVPGDVLKGGQGRFAAYLDNVVEYETLQSKLNVEITRSGKTMASRATLKVVKGEAVNLSVHPVLGIELFRVVLTPENFLLIDRMGKRYVSEPIEDLEKALNIKLDFEMLQALFTNQIFYPQQKQPVAFRSFNDSPVENGISYTPKSEPTGYDCRFVLDAVGLLIRTTVSDLFGKASMQWSYNSFVSLQKKKIPSSVHVSALFGNEKVELLIESSDFQVNKAVDIDTSVSSRYQKISLDQLNK